VNVINEPAKVKFHGGRVRGLMFGFRGGAAEPSAAPACQA
jgi:hypothetical protein